jgi:TPR repeat protein
MEFHLVYVLFMKKLISAFLITCIGPITAFSSSESKSDLESKCQKGDAKACFFRGDIDLKSRHEKESLEWYKKSAKLGAAPAFNQLGILYFTGQGVKQDSLLGHQCFVMAARLGFSNAAMALAQIWWSGQGVPKDMVMGYMFYLIAGGAASFSSLPEQNKKQIESDINALSAKQKADAQKDAESFKMGIQILSNPKLAKYFKEPVL